jgi:hypothetical protein
VTRLYVRDSFLIDMNADKTTQRGAGFRTDQIGKVFIVVGRDVRQCLICEQFFTRRAASEHSTVLCMPRIKMKTKGQMNAKIGRPL